MQIGRGTEKTSKIQGIIYILLWVRDTILKIVKFN